MYEYDFSKKSKPADSETAEPVVSETQNAAAPHAKKKASSVVKKCIFTVVLAAIFGCVSAVSFYFTNSMLDGNRRNRGISRITDDTEEAMVLNDKKTGKVKEDDEIELIPEMPEKESSIDSSEDNDETESEDIESTGTGKPDGETSVEEVADRVMPSIVAITNSSVQELNTFGRGKRQYESKSAGSGIIIGQNDTELLIVSNAHVVEGADTLSVCFIDDEACEAVTKGVDSSNDLAVVAVKLSDIPGKTLQAIKIAELGDSDEMRIGQRVVAIGNALGYGQSVTTGIVSAVDRSIDKDGKTRYIQTDAAINPGNSGGALLNMEGKVIGINSAKLASQYIEGMGYAIPISAANPIIEKLMIKTTREKLDEREAGYLGIVGLSVTEDVSYSYGIPKGAYIQDVVIGEAADRAGIREGDVIVAFDGLSIDGIDKLSERLNYYKEGEVVEVVVAREDGGEYEEITLEVKLSSRIGTAIDPDKK